MFQKPLIVAVVSVLVGMGAHARAACLDVRQTQPLVFKGSLSRPVFPGPPNYEDVKKGDKPERAYIIKLDAGSAQPATSSSTAAKPSTRFSSWSTIRPKTAVRSTQAWVNSSANALRSPANRDSAPRPVITMRRCW
jgi:hypothetical protein